MCWIVKPGRLAVKKEREVLTALALGSSLCICMYDGETGIGGMAHTLLPECVPGRETSGPRYVDKAVTQLYEAMLHEGAEKKGLCAKLAGGARIFSFPGQRAEEDVGRLNVNQAHRLIQELGVPILSEDTGENYGRTAHFYLEDGRLEIETAGRLKYTI